MEVTKTNFQSLLPEIKEAIEECTFLAIDTELTGLHDRQKNNAFDTMEDRYIKMRQTAGDFLIIQLGVSCFSYHSEEKKYTHKDFNFYVFCDQPFPQVPDTCFKSSASSLRFLSSHKFDFNKLFGEGISYLTPIQEEKTRLHLQTMYEEKKKNLIQKMDEGKNNKPPPPNIPREHKDFIDAVLKEVADYVKSDRKEPLQLQPCNGYLRWLIYQSVQHKHPSGLNLATTNKDVKQTFITVTKLTDQERIEQLKQQHATNMKNLDDAVGFRKVLEIISQSKKLILGHNMLLDVFHIIRQFFYPAPETLDEFKSLVNCIFPHILDTKTLASAFFKSSGLATALFELHEEMITRKFTLLPIEPASSSGTSYNMIDEQPHEAGYDAYITGSVFVHMTTKIAEDNRLEYISPSNKLLSPHANRPYIMRHYDIQSLNLNGPDPEGNRDNVFFVTFPKTWRASDLVDLFQDFGEIYISWMDDTSAFVALKISNQYINVDRTLVKNSNSLYKVTTFADYYKRHLAKDDVMPQKKRNNRSSDLNDVDASATVPEEQKEISNSNDKQNNCVSPTPKRIKVIQEVTEKTPSESKKLFEEPVWEK